MKKFNEMSKKVKHRIKSAVLLVLVFITAFLGSFLGFKMAGNDTQTATSTSTMNITKTSASNAGSDSESKVIAAASKSVVEIATESKQSGQFNQDAVTTGAGSGVIISSNGYIVTNYHVIEGASTIKVTTSDNKTYSATVVGYDDENDIAVVKINASDLTVAAIGNSDKLEVGNAVYAIGNPLGELGGTVTEGIISATSREVTIEGQEMTLLQTSAAINAGNSGGGLFNANGELIGIVNAKTSGSDIEGLGFAIPSNTAIEVANQLVKNGYVSGKYKIGITMVNIAGSEMRQYYGVNEDGIYVSNVTEGGVAANAGFKVGDRIISVNGKEYDETGDIASLIKSSKSGDSIKFIIERNGKKQTLTIKVD